MVYLVKIQNIKELKQKVNDDAFEAIAVYQLPNTYYRAWILPWTWRAINGENLEIIKLCYQTWQLFILN